MTNCFVPTIFKVEDNKKMKKEKTIQIRRIKGACCPDCTIINGYCYNMHNILIEKAKLQTAKEIFKDIDKKVISDFGIWRLPIYDEIKQKHLTRGK